MWKIIINDIWGGVANIRRALNLLKCKRGQVNDSLLHRFPTGSRESVPL